MLLLLRICYKCMYVINCTADSYGDGPPIVQQNHGSKFMLDELCEWVAKVEAAMSTSESFTQESDIGEVKEQLLQHEVWP